MQSARDKIELLLGTVRIRFDRMRKIFFKRELFRDLVDPLLSLLGIGDTVHRGNALQIMDAAYPLISIAQIGHIPRFRFESAEILLYVFPVETNFAAVRPQDTDDTFDRRALPRAVCADQPNDLPCLKAQIYPADDHIARGGIGLLQAAHFQQGIPFRQRLLGDGGGFKFFFLRENRTHLDAPVFKYINIVVYKIENVHDADDPNEDDHPIEGIEHRPADMKGDAAQRHQERQVLRDGILDDVKIVYVRIVNMQDRTHDHRKQVIAEKQGQNFRDLAALGARRHAKQYAHDGENDQHGMLIHIIEGGKLPKPVVDQRYGHRHRRTKHINIIGKHFQRTPAKKKAI